MTKIQIPIVRMQAAAFRTALTLKGVGDAPTLKQCAELLAAAHGSQHGLISLSTHYRNRKDHVIWDLSRATARVIQRAQRMTDVYIDAKTVEFALMCAWPLDRSASIKALVHIVPRSQQKGLGEALQKIWDNEYTIDINLEGIRISDRKGLKTLYEDKQIIKSKEINDIIAMMPDISGGAQTTGLPGTLHRIYQQQGGIRIDVTNHQPQQLDIPLQQWIGSTSNSLLIVGGAESKRFSQLRQMMSIEASIGRRIVVTGMIRWLAGTTEGVGAIHPKIMSHEPNDLNLKETDIDRILYRLRPNTVYIVQTSINGGDLPLIQPLLKAGIRVVLDTRLWEPNTYHTNSFQPDTIYRL